MSGCGCEVEIKDKSERRVLIVLLLINGVMFAVELIVGWLAQSTALIADALDMLADAMVYGVGKSLLLKADAARISGGLQILLGLLVLVDILRRIIVGSEPVSVLMMGMGLIALIANFTCLILIARHREGDVHMRASWIFSRNDVIANLGVIFAGGLVAWTGSRLPDLTIGLLVALIVIRGGILILQDAKATRTQHLNQSHD